MESSRAHVTKEPVNVIRKGAVKTVGSESAGKIPPSDVGRRSNLSYAVPHNNPPQNSTSRDSMECLSFEKAALSFISSHKNCASICLFSVQDALAYSLDHLSWSDACRPLATTSDQLLHCLECRTVTMQTESCGLISPG
jgi:hypothetical protein